MNPPSALHSAMSRERKPFTYTPGGLDLSEIKSERMAKRLMRNAMNQGVPEIPLQQVQSPPASGNPVMVPNFNCLPVQVFPTISLPANPKSLLRTRSNPNPKEAPIQRAPPPQPNQFPRPSKPENITSLYTPSTNTNNNYQRPVSMYEYNAPSNNANTFPRMDFGSNEPSCLPEISYEAEFCQAPRRIIASKKPVPEFKYDSETIVPESPGFVDLETKQRNVDDSASLFQASPRNSNGFNAVIAQLESKHDNKARTSSYNDYSNFERTPQNNYNENYKIPDLNISVKSEVIDLDQNKLKNTSNNNKIPDSDISLKSEIIDTTKGHEVSECFNIPDTAVKRDTDFERKQHDSQEVQNNDCPSSDLEHAAVNENQVDLDFSIQPIAKIPSPFENLVDDESRSDDEQRVVKKQVKKESKSEVQNGEQEAQMTVKLPTKKAAAKTETKVEVVKKQLPDGSIEEIKTTTTKTTVDGKTTISTKTETTIIPKEEEEEVEVEEEEEEQEEENGEVVIEENGDDEAVEEVVVVKKSPVVQNGHTVVKKEETSETVVTKKVSVVQKQEPEEEEVEEEVEEEEVQEEVKKEVKSASEASKEEVVEEEEEEIVEEKVEAKKEEVEEEEVEEVVEESKNSKEVEPTKEEVEEEYEEAEEEKVEKPEPAKEQKDEESEYTEEEYESEKEEPPKPALQVAKEEPDKKEPVKEEVKAEEAKEEVKQEPEQKEVKPEPEPAPKAEPAPKVEPTVPLREPSIPLEKVEEVEIKPIGLTSETVTKSHTENTEIVTDNEKPTGQLSTQTEYNRVENIVTVNRTTKTLDQSYEQLTQHGVPTVKAYFAPPNRDRVSTSPLPARPYQPVYHPQAAPSVNQPQERRHSLLLERLSMERQVPSSDVYQNSYQYSNQTFNQQNQYSHEPQAEVLNVSNVKPSTITNSQWYQQQHQQQQVKKENVLYNNVSAPSQTWNQSQPAQQQLPTQPQYQPTYTENTTQDRSTSYQNTYQPYTPTPATWGASSDTLSSSYNTQQNQYSLVNQSTTTESYQKSTQQSSQNYSSSYVPPPWEQDASYVADVSNQPQNYYQPPPSTNTFSPNTNQGWTPAPPKSKFTKPPPTAYIPPAPNQSFVKPVVLEPPRVPGKKTYYSEYERRYITVPESTYIPSETKYQPQPDPSPQYYYDNNEPAETVEPQWRKELREFTEKTSTQTVEHTSVKPPWEEDPKYAKPPSNTVMYTATPTWSQTLRPRSWRERSFESEYVGSQETSKTSTLGRGRPLSSYAKNNVEPIPERVRGVSVDRYNPTNYQSPITIVADHPPVPTHTLNVVPPTKTYHNPNVPAYHAQSHASAEPKEHSVYPQARNWGGVESRASPIQSRSFKYLQWITGTDD